MSTIFYIDATIIICILYLLFLFRKRKYRLLLPCTIHTLTWLMVCVLIRLTMAGSVSEYVVGDILRSYDYVAPFIFSLVLTSVIGFTLAHSIRVRKSTGSGQISLEQIDVILQRYHWILYICLALGILQTVFLISAVGFANLGDYRVAAVTLNRSGYGAFAQQFSGHATILGTFYFGILGYKMGYSGINMKRFLWDGFLLASTNLAIAGRGWIITIMIPFFITYFWQKNELGEKLINKDTKNILMIFVSLMVAFSLVGQIRNDGGVVEKSRFWEKFTYYTDGARITNMALATFPEESFDKEYGRAEFLSKWFGSPMTERFQKAKSNDVGTSVTVSSALPYLYFDYGFIGGAFMWGVFCFFIETYALKFRKPRTIIQLLLFLELVKVLFQSPVGPVFSMEIPVMEWMVILCVFRKRIFRV